MLLALWLSSTLTACTVVRAAFTLLGSTPLGPDPQTVNSLNGESFQQDALVTLNGQPASCVYACSLTDPPATRPGYQYAVFWTPSPANASVRHACVSRRDLRARSAWETFTLTDYDQTDDDGHNVYAHPIRLGLIFI